MLSRAAPKTRMTLALPIHSGAGLRGLGHGPRVGGLGSLGFFEQILGSVIGGLFSSNSESKQIRAQQERDQLQASISMQQARLERELGGQQIDAAIQTSRIQAANELAAITSGYAAQLSAQRVKKQVAEDTLSADLLNSTQMGIFGLAQSGLSQATSLSQSYASSATKTLVFLVLGTAAAVAFMRAPKRGGKNKKRRKVKAGKFDYESSNFNEHPSFGSAQASFS